MKILIDARNVFKGKNGPSEYGLNLVRSMVQIPSGNEYVLIKNNEWPEGLAGKSSVREIVLDLKPYDLREQAVLTKTAGREKADIFHSLLPFTSFFIRAKTIITLQDMMAITFPGFFRKRGRMGKLIRAYYSLMTGMSVRLSSAVLTTSNFAMKDIENHFKLPGKKVFACSAGINERYLRIDERKKETVRSKYGLPGKYLFHIGNMAPYKNVLRIIEAFNVLLKMNSDDIKLVLGGRPDEAYLQEISFKIKQLGLEDQVVIIKSPDKDDIPYIYAMAAALVFPSLSEGFGLPILEAMASGTPVITSNAASMPEVAGDAAILVDPNDVESISGAMYNILMDEKQRKMLIEKGLQRVKQFTWENTARKVLDMYEKVMAKR